MAVGAGDEAPEEQALREAAVSPSPEPGPEPEQQPDASDEAKKRPKRRRSYWKELPVLIVLAFVLALLIKTFAIQAFWIPSGSMENTLDINDRVLINKLAYDFGSIHRGDVVVFSGAGAGNWDGPVQSTGNIVVRFFRDIGQLVGLAQDEHDYVKRVIGLPGDHVACCDAKGRVTVNGVALNESGYLYPGATPSDTPFKVTVPPGRLWVMGDHRNDSSDSRAFGHGPIPESAVLGKVFVRIWPASRWGFVGTPATFGQAGLASALGSGVPLALGFVGAVPLTLATRRVRSRRARPSR